MHWTEIARRKHAEANRALASAVNRTTISVPAQTSPTSAPGWLHLGNFFSCVPDALYPWNLEVLRAIRENVAEDAMPLVVRSVWSWVNYNELGHRADRLLILTHHGMARAVRDVHPSVRHDFPCPLPVHFPPGLRIPGRTNSQCRPNQIFDIWQDGGVRAWGPDLPGAYLPFDWDYYYALKRGEDHRIRMLRASRLAEDSEGNLIAKGAAEEDVAALQKGRAEEKAAEDDQRSYIARDLLAYHSEPASDLEWRDKMLSDSPSPKPGHVVTGKGEAA